MNKLITKSLELGRTSLLFRVAPELLTELEIKIVEWIRQYILKYGVNPTLQRVVDEFAYFMPEMSSDPIEDIFESELITRKNIFVRTEFSKCQAELVKGADPTDLIMRLAKTVNTAKGDMVTTAAYDRSKYFLERTTYSFGVDFIDSMVGGISGGDLCWVVGRPGSNKTTFAEWCLTNWALAGLKILYVSNENMADDVIHKLDSFFGGWNPMNLRTNAWTPEDRAKVEAAAHIVPLISGLITVPSEPALTTAEIMALIEEHKPDLVLIDGVYLMSESKKPVIGWEDAAAVSRAIKRLARKTGLPFVGVIQANRDAEGEMVGRGTIAHTDAYLQDADTIIALNKQPDSKVIGQIIKTRWGVTDLQQSFAMQVDFETMQLSFLNDTVVEVAEEDW